MKNIFLYFIRTKADRENWRTTCGRCKNNFPKNKLFFFGWKGGNYYCKRCLLIHISQEVGIALIVVLLMILFAFYLKNTYY